MSRPIAKVEFLAEADRICHSTNARVEAAADDLATERPRPATGGGAPGRAGVAVPALEAEVQAIGSLGPRAATRARSRRSSRATKRGIAQIEADPAGVVDGPPPALRKAGRLARAYGSAECDAEVGSRG